MMRIEIGEDLGDLAVDLAERLADPLADPMTPEIIVVPTAGMQRWLALELSRRLGTSGGDRTDGIAANIDMVFPGRLTRLVLDAEEESEDDPWELEAMAWMLLGILTTHPEPDFPALAPGATEWARARRLADLFDRYMTHRPEMIRAWARGGDIDGSGRSIENRALWQPRLWRCLRDHIGTASPPETLPTRIEALRAGDCPSSVPERVSLFGLTTVPGGASFLELLEALGTQCDVGLFLHQPSRVLAMRIGSTASDATASSQVRPNLLRTEDDSAALVNNPLLRSWGRSARETMALLSGANHLQTSTAGEPSGNGSITLLARFQADLRADNAPDGNFVSGISASGAAADGSIRIHSCHGDTRQVEVLRDQILHLLAADATLTEEDIVVLCPALERFAPTIESVFGPSAESGRLEGTPELQGRVPALRYRLSDRSLGSTYPLLGAMGDLVELLASRFSDQAVVNFIALPPVRRRFGFDDEAVEQITSWIHSANVRWGMNGAQRQRWGVPAAYTDGTFLKAVDRLMAGITTSNDPSVLAHGEVAPLAVEGNGIPTAGKLASLLSLLSGYVEDAQHPKPVRDWLTLLEGASTELFEVDPDRPWERARLTGIFEQMAKAPAHTIPDEAVDSNGTPDPNQVLLTLADVRHLIGDQLGKMPGRPGFFRGGITISTPTPLRGVPHRVVCLLGMDESAFSSGAPDGDDLMGADPHLGDRDNRADLRQVLLDSVLAARDHLVLLRNGRDVVTNQAVPPAVVVAEITEALQATVGPERAEQLRKELTTVHPRQRFDEHNFISEGSGENSGTSTSTGTGGPWSFDPLAMAAAIARRSARASPTGSSMVGSSSTTLLLSNSTSSTGSLPILRATSSTMC